MSNILKIFCCDCSKKVNAKLITGKSAYPHRKDLYELNFYQCPKCKCFVGCHKGTIKPLGVISSKEIKRAKRHIHALLDPLWKEGLIKRGVLYEKISDKIGYSYHTANLRSIEECRNVYIIIREIKRDLTKVF